jgi:hypothetical protein
MRAPYRRVHRSCPSWSGYQAYKSRRTCRAICRRCRRNSDEGPCIYFKLQRRIEQRFPCISAPFSDFESIRIADEMYDVIHNFRADIYEMHQCCGQCHHLLVSYIHTFGFIVMFIRRRLSIDSKSHQASIEGRPSISLSRRLTKTKATPDIRFPNSYSALLTVLTSLTPVPSATLASTTS